MAETRFHYFTKVFAGYQFVNKNSGDNICKIGIYARFFKYNYPEVVSGEGMQVPEFLSPERESEFFTICTMFGSNILPINKHWEIEIRDTDGWKDGVVVDRSRVFLIDKEMNRQNHDWDTK